MEQIRKIKRWSLSLGMLLSICAHGTNQVDLEFNVDPSTYESNQSATRPNQLENNTPQPPTKAKTEGDSILQTYSRNDEWYANPIASGARQVPYDIVLNETHVKINDEDKPFARNNWNVITHIELGRAMVRVDNVRTDVKLMAEKKFPINLGGGKMLYQTEIYLITTVNKKETRLLISTINVKTDLKNNKILISAIDPTKGDTRLVANCDFNCKHWNYNENISNFLSSLNIDLAKWANYRANENKLKAAKNANNTAAGLGQVFTLANNSGVSEPTPPPPAIQCQTYTGGNVVP